jgi:putative chitinase
MTKPSQKTRTETVQRWLNALLQLDPPLAITGKLDHPTKEALKKYQTRKHLKASGLLTTDTWKALGTDVGTVLDIADTILYLPQSLVNLLRGQSVVVMRYDRAVFFAGYMAQFGGLDDAQLMGLEALLRYVEVDPDVTDTRWAAYMLATVRTECANTWLPIAEYGCNDTTGCTTTKDGNARSYGKPKACPTDLHKEKDHGTPLTLEKVCPAGKSTHTYYGRGYVQLTHAGNYKKLGVELGWGEYLLHHPEKVMEPDLAYRIMSYGMRHGSFTGRKLSDFLNKSKTDYFHARSIINTINDKTKAHAHVMEHEAEKIDHLLVESLI